MLRSILFYDHNYNEVDYMYVTNKQINWDIRWIPSLENIFILLVSFTSSFSLEIYCSLATTSLLRFSDYTI